MGEPSKKQPPGLRLVNAARKLRKASKEHARRVGFYRAAVTDVAQQQALDHMGWAEEALEAAALEFSAAYYDCNAKIA